MRPRLSGLVFVLAMSLARCVIAGEASVEEKLQRGVEMMRLGQYKEALAEFLQADRIAPSPRTESQIALAEQALGSSARGEALLLEALQSAEDPWIKGHRRLLEGALQQMRAHIGEIVVQTKPPIAMIKVNGDVHSSGKIIRVDEGEASIEVEAEGYEPSVRRVPVKAGAKVNELFLLVPRAPRMSAPTVLIDRAPPPTESRSSGISTRSRFAGAFILFAGAGGLGVGTYLLGRDGMESCNTSGATCPTRSTRVSGGLTLGISAAAAVVGATLLNR